MSSQCAKNRPRRFPDQTTVGTTHPIEMRPRNGREGIRASLTEAIKALNWLFPGGAEGNRTPDLLDANESRYQLRHSP